MIPLIMLGPGGWAGYGLYEGLNFAIPMPFLKLSQQHEYEADYLGLEYMYAAGYDPNAFVAFFEKIETEEKRQPGTVPKFFSTHPPTPDRVVAVQKEVGNVLPAREQYIVTTSEFDAVKTRLQGIENRDSLTLRSRSLTNLIVLQVRPSKMKICASAFTSGIAGGQEQAKRRFRRRREVQTQKI
jgi:predicted Zn-dependent protease